MVLFPKFFNIAISISSEIDIFKFCKLLNISLQLVINKGKYKYVKLFLEKLRDKVLR